jgi:hypothetical protein
MSDLDSPLTLVERLMISDDADDVEAADELTRLTALVAEQQRQIEEGETRVAELQTILDVAEAVKAASHRDWSDELERRLKAEARVAELEKERAKQWCESCGTVSNTGECDCTMGGRPELRKPVDYADAMQKEAREQFERFSALQSSARQMKEALEFYYNEWRMNGEGVDEPGLWHSWLEPTEKLWDDAGQKAHAALQSAASIDIGHASRKEAADGGDQSPEPVPAIDTSQYQIFLRATREGAWGKIGTIVRGRLRFNAEKDAHYYDVVLPNGWIKTGLAQYKFKQISEIDAEILKPADFNRAKGGGDATE